MYITLKGYLENLESLERSKPEGQRLHVPSMGELADAVGIHRVTLANIANGNIKQLNLATGGRIITALRNFGFPTTVSDIISYRPPDTDTAH